MTIYAGIGKEYLLENPLVIFNLDAPHEEEGDFIIENISITNVAASPVDIVFDPLGLEPSYPPVFVIQPKSTFTSNLKIKVRSGIYFNKLNVDGEKITVMFNRRDL